MGNLPNNHLTETINARWRYRALASNLILIGIALYSHLGGLLIVIDLKRYVSKLNNNHI